jgi:hypothetical protein
MPLSRRITDTQIVQEEVIELVAKTIYVEEKKIVIKEVKREVLNHKEVTYKDKKYIVGYCLNNDEDILFIFDYENKEKVITRKWHLHDEFISNTITESDYNKKTKQLYLHNLLFDAKDKANFINHINKNIYDNRLENLRELTSDEYNFNQSKIISNLPENCEIDPKDIPKYITYHKSSISHGDKFVIDIKLSNINIYWISTTSKNVETKKKLNEAIIKLKEFYKTNKELMELNNKVNNYTKQYELKKSFNDILSLSGYPSEIIKKNLVNVEDIHNIEIQLEEINENKEYVNEIKPVIIEELSFIENNKSLMVHKDVNYKNKKYTVGYCSFKYTEDILFVIDYDKKDFVVKNKWRYNNDTKYICKTYVDIEGNSKWLHLHSFIMNGLVFDQGHAISIDHINQIKRDNRLENLRKLTQSDQNVNQKKRERTTELPEGCGINPQDIPTNIYYRKAHGLHGDRFYVEIKNVVPPFTKDSSSSKLIDLKTKLQQAILILEEYKHKNPQYANLLFDLKDVQTRNDLRKSFNEILKLSKFPQEIIDKNLVEIEEEKLEEEIDEDAKDLAKQLVEQGFKGVASNLPPDCGVTPNMIPKYCYYKPASDKRGDKFIIERHPKLVEKGLRQWATTEAKSKTTKQKFDLMIQKLVELEN